MFFGNLKKNIKYVLSNTGISCGQQKLSSAYLALCYKKILVSPKIGVQPSHRQESGGSYGGHRAWAYNRDLMADPSEGSRGSLTLVRGLGWSRRHFVFQKCKWGANLIIYDIFIILLPLSYKLLKYAFWKNVVAFLFEVILLVVTMWQKVRA